MERLKAYSNYIVIILLSGEIQIAGEMHKPYKLFHFTEEQMGKLRTITYNGHKYRLDQNYLSYMHGWCPWLIYNPWSPWRMCYNWLYGWYHATGLLIFKEPEDKLHGVEIGIEPLGYPKERDEKWSPALVRGVSMSTLYEKYDARLSYGGFHMTWKVWVIIGIGLIAVLLIMTGVIPVPGINKPRGG